MSADFADQRCLRAGSSSVESKTLPRLLVVTDVQVERTGANSLLLHRLLAEYPTDRLRIVFVPELASADRSLRLPGVDYRPFEYRIPRLLRNRINPLWPWMASHQVARLADQVLAAAGSDFRPEAILSVAHTFLWFAADRISRRQRIPLHLFLHEEWPNLVTRNRPGWIWDRVRGACRARMRPILRNAASLFAVSPGMVEETQKRYGVRSELFYPNRGPDSPEPKIRMRPDWGKQPVIAHCGYVHFAGNAALIREISRIVGGMDGHVDFYTTHTDAELAWHGLKPPTARRIGFFPSKEMAERLGATAELLLLTASFDPADRVHESTLFPSKTADYTAVGLPILVWGPPYSSAARWAAENPGATLLFTDPDPAPVERAIRRILDNASEAAELAVAGIAAGLGTVRVVDRRPPVSGAAPIEYSTTGVGGAAQLQPPGVSPRGGRIRGCPDAPSVRVAGDRQLQSAGRRGCGGSG